MKLNGLKTANLENYLNCFLRGAGSAHDCALGFVASFAVGSACLILFVLSYCLRCSAEFGVFCLAGAVLFYFFGALYWGKYWALKMCGAAKQ